MPRTKSSYLNELSTSDLKKLLAARERIDVLEGEKETLLKKLQAIETELAQLVSGVDSRGGSAGGAGKKVARKKTARKKVVRKKAVKKTTGKAAAKKGTTKKGTTKKAATRKTATHKATTKKARGKKAPARKTALRKAPARQRRGGGKVSLVDVVVGVLEKAGQPLPFKEILSIIHGGKLYQTKSKSFDNLLRKTLSSSDRFKRAGRGIYTLA